MRATPQWWLRFVRLVSWSALCAGALLALSGLTACSSNTVKTTALPTPTKQDVRLAVDRSSYTVSQPVGVMLTNAGQANYYAVDGRSGCTYLQLQMYDTKTKNWVSVDGCTTPTQSQARLIPPGANEPFTLAPGTDPNNRNAWLAGTYRVALQYSAQADGGGTPLVSFSPGFTITA